MGERTDGASQSTRTARGVPGDSNQSQQSTIQVLPGMDVSFAYYGDFFFCVCVCLVPLNESRGV